MFDCKWSANICFPEVCGLGEVWSLISKVWCVQIWPFEWCSSWRSTQAMVILSSYVDWFCFVFLFDTDNIETGSSFIISHGTTTVLFISLTDIEIQRFTRKKQEFGLKYSNGSTVGNINTIQVQIEQQLTKHMGPLRPYRPPPAWKSTSYGTCHP